MDYFVPLDAYKVNPNKWMPDWLEAGADDADVCINLVHSRPMTKFERAVLVGHRANQISQGSAPRARGKTDNPLDIAAAEIDTGTLRGMRVIRYLSDGTAVQKTASEISVAKRRVREW